MQNKLISKQDLNRMLADACRHGDVKLAKEVLDAGADVNYSVNYGWTPLMRAATFANIADNHGLINHLRVVNELLKRGADPTMRDGMNRTAADLSTPYDGYRISDFILPIHNVRIVAQMVITKKLAKAEERELYKALRDTRESNKLNS